MSFLKDILRYLYELGVVAAAIIIVGLIAGLMYSPDARLT